MCRKTDARNVPSTWQKANDCWHSYYRYLITFHPTTGTPLLNLTNINNKIAAPQITIGALSVQTTAMDRELAADASISAVGSSPPQWGGIVLTGGRSEKIQPCGKRLGASRRQYPFFGRSCFLAQVSIDKPAHNRRHCRLLVLNLGHWWSRCSLLYKACICYFSRFNDMSYCITGHLFCKATNLFNWLLWNVHGNNGLPTSGSLQSMQGQTTNNTMFFRLLLNQR